MALNDDAEIGQWQMKEIHSLVVGADHRNRDDAPLANIVDNVSRLVALVAGEMLWSLEEYLSVAATAGDCVKQNPTLAGNKRLFSTTD